MSRVKQTAPIAGRTFVTVKQDDLVPVEREVLAQAIVNISKSFDRLIKSGLNRRAIIILIASETKLGLGQIENVLCSLERLAHNYTHSPSGKKSEFS